MKTQFNVTGFLSNIRATLENGPVADPVELIYNKLAHAYAHRYSPFAAIPFLDKIEDEQERKLMHLAHNDLRQRLNSLIFENQYGPLFERALRLEPQALDQACEIMVEHFFTHKKITQAAMEWDNRKLLVDHDIELNSDLGQDMLKAASSIYAEYKTLHNRATAGDLFGLFDSEEEADEYRDQAADLLEKAINDVYERYYPDEPDPPAY